MYDAAEKYVAAVEARCAAGFAGFVNCPGMKLLGVLRASSSALAIAPFMPFAPSVRTSSAPYARMSCLRSTDIVSAAFLERHGVKTDVDALRSIERYLFALKQLLYHTDDIQKLRRLEEVMRKTFSSDELNEELAFLDEQRDSGKLSADEYDEKREKAFETLGSLKNHGTYVEWLMNYTNKLAGKQQRVDRGIFAERFSVQIARAHEKFCSSAVDAKHIFHAVASHVDVICRPPS